MLLAMKEKGINWFKVSNDYYDILDYTSVDYKSVYSYKKHYVQNMKG